VCWKLNWLEQNSGSDYVRTGILKAVLFHNAINHFAMFCFYVVFFLNYIMHALSQNWNRSLLFQAPPRADVVKYLRNNIWLNVLGMGAAVLGMQATVGALVAKALTTSSVPYYQGIPPGQSPVLALDIFLVQVWHCLFSAWFFALWFPHYSENSISGSFVLYMSRGVFLIYNGRFSYYIVQNDVLSSEILEHLGSW
jgi:hypothetical protein